MNKTFSLYDIGDYDAPYWVAEDTQGNILARGNDRDKVAKEAATKLKELPINSPNFENTDVGFLMRD